MNIWASAGIISVIILIYFFKPTKNAVWGGLTLGLIVSMIIINLNSFRGTGLNWYIILNGAIIGTFLGFIAELLGKFSDHLKNK